MIVKNGIAYFAIKDNLIPTTNSPIEILIITKSETYLSTSKRIFITYPGTSNHIVNMMRLTGNLPSGVTTNSQSFGNVATTSGTTINIQASSGGTYPARLIVPQNTVLRDANGNVLSGNVSTQITSFDPTNRAAVPNFPGGFSVNTNTTGNGAFISAGFAAINMRVNGVEVETFSQPVSIQIGINPQVINPVTGNPVRSGDVIPVWSYDENTGVWKFEGNHTVNSKINSSGDQEFFIKKDDVTHLSWYNLDWFWNSCQLAAPINFVGGCWNILYWYLEFANGQGYLGQGIVLNWNPTLNFIYAPDNIPVRILVFENLQALNIYLSTGQLTNLVGSQVINNLCQTTPINVTISTQLTGTDVNITVRGVCPNGNILDQGTLDLEIFKDGYWQFAGRIINGQITIKCLQIGQTYNFRIFYNGQYYERQQQITSANMLVEIPLPGDISFCN